jgi:hypothetical protein
MTYSAQLKAEIKVVEAWLEIPDDMSMDKAVEIATQEGNKIIKVDKKNRRIQIWQT